MSTTSSPRPSAAAEPPDALARDAEGWVTAAPPRAVEVMRRIVAFPYTLARHRDLVVTSVRRELQARFTGTVLGMAWPLVHPVFLFLVYYFIFTKLLNMRFPGLPDEQKAAMGVFMFVGVAVWAAFGDTLTRCCGVILENGNLIKKLVFPAEVLPLNIVVVNMITMLFAVGIFLAVIVLTPVWVAPDPLRLLWIVPLVLVQALFAYGLGLVLATMHVFLRDTLQVITIVVTVWMFTTPIFWSPELVIGFVDADTVKPLEGSDIEPYLPWLRLNPLYHLVYAWRCVLMSEQPAVVFGTFGDSLPQSFAIVAAWALGAFVVGYSMFILAQRRFADEV